MRSAPAQSGLWLNSAVSTARPPADIVDEHAAAYLLSGIRAQKPAREWQLGAGVNFGNSFDGGAGRWTALDGDVTRSWLHRATTVTFSSSFEGLRYTRPFRYSALSAALAPSITHAFGATEVTATPHLIIGKWELPEADGDITVSGLSAGGSRSFGAVTAHVSADAYEARNGAVDGGFRGLSFDVNAPVARFEVGAGVRYWRTPVSDEFGFDAYAMRDLTRDVRITGYVGRSVTDPVLGSPANFGASLAVSWRFASFERRQPPPVATVLGAAPAGRRVRFTVENESATTAAVSGSFSNWTPIPMHRDGKSFTVEIVLPPGGYQYGFLLNGSEWYLPPNAGGLVDDGFGRKNATLVIERK